MNETRIDIGTAESNLEMLKTTVIGKYHLFID
jgi:hypothetical protein